MFVWGFDKTKTGLDDLIEFFEKGFENVVNIRRRTIPSIENPKDYTVLCVYCDLVMCPFKMFHEFYQSISFFFRKENLLDLFG